jgi:glycosyltransferase involved in cell wall biosynthesis
MTFFVRKPLVSVILPSFNHVGYVGEAAQSVLDQTFRDLELIVVDDGSVDGTADVIASIRDPRVTLIRLSENRASHPRNLALDRAKGKYVAFQNSDDVWIPEKLAAQLEVMERANRCVACFTAAQIINESGLPASGTWADDIFTTLNRTSGKWLQYFFDAGNCLPLPSALARRADLIESGGFRASLVQLGDFDLWIRLAALGEFFILPGQLTQIRIIEGANLSRPSPRGQRRSLIELATVLERYTEFPILDQLNSIFPDLPKTPNSGARKIAVSLRAWKQGGGAYALFADRTVAGVMENARERADAVAVHGPEFIHIFLENRCESEFIRRSGACTDSKWKRLARWLSIQND